MIKWIWVFCSVVVISGCAEQNTGLTTAQLAACSPYVLNNGDSLYKEGKSAYFQRDLARAKTCYELAARYKNPYAEFDLGQMYEDGEGVASDMQTAVYWYQRAADTGNTDAQFTLGVLYATGKGVTKDSKKAFYWQKKAAELGNVYAQTSLGIMYSTGQGVARDNVAAYAWLSIAAEKGFPLAREKQQEVRRVLNAAAYQEAASLVQEIHAGRFDLRPQPIGSPE